MIFAGIGMLWNVERPDTDNEVGVIVLMFEPRQRRHRPDGRRQGRESECRTDGRDGRARVLARNLTGATRCRHRC